jgi:uncharacterized protein YraI
MRRVSKFSLMMSLSMAALLAFLTLAPTLQAHAALTATVIVDLLNVRKAPRTNYPIVATYKRGEKVTLIGRNAGGTWLEVSGGFGKGWVSSQFVIVSGEIGVLPITQGDIAPFITIVVFPSVSVRAGPSLNYPVVGVLRQGAAADVIGQDPKSVWLEIVSGSVRGWIQSQYTSITGNIFAAPNTDDQVTPYVFTVNYRTNVRNAPSTKGAVITVVGYQQYFKIIGVSSDRKWWLISTSAGNGWVAASLVQAIGIIGNVPVVN